MRNYSLIVLLLLTMFGCGSNAADQMGGGYVLPPWQDLSTFQEETLLLVAYPREEQNWAKVKQILTSEEFEAGFSKLEQSPLPSDYSKRQSERDATVNAFRAAINAAKSGSESEMKTKLDEAFTALSALQAS